MTYSLCTSCCYASLFLHHVVDETPVVQENLMQLHSNIKGAVMTSKMYNDRALTLKE